MSPAPPGPESTKSWKKINEERKLLKKKRKQEKLLKDLERSSKIEELKEAEAVKSRSKPQPSTLSIAVPGSILENAQSVELRSYVAGQIARAACIFRVNEIIVFDDVGLATARETKRNYEEKSSGFDGADASAGTVRSSSLQLARILQYLECPQYLRKFFFPLHKDLKYTGLLNPLDAPHHLRQQNVFRYREGVVVSEKKAREGHSYVNVGLLNDVLVDKAIAPGVRVTVKLGDYTETSRKLRGSVVSPDEPRRETGVYWGYNVRIAHSFSEIFTGSPYKMGYDVTIGTSDRGTSVQEIDRKSYVYNNLLIIFGGLKGLEVAIANDDKLNVDDPSLLFDHYINVLPKQGSRTIRTEEALLIALAALQEKIEPKVADVQMDLSEFLPGSDNLQPLAGSEPQQFSQTRKKHKQSNETLGSVKVQTNSYTTKLKHIDSDNSKRSPVHQMEKVDSALDVAESKMQTDDFELVPVGGGVSKVETSTKLDYLNRFD